MKKKNNIAGILTLLLAVSIMVFAGYGCDPNNPGGCGTPGTDTDTSANTDTSTETNTSTGTETSGLFRVRDGKITKNGNELPIHCGAWFGLEGQHEPKGQPNGDGAPMELYVGNMWWDNTGRTIEQTMQEITAKGFNVIRLPIAPQTLDPNDPQGKGDREQGGALKNHESVRQESARQMMEDFIKLADQHGLYVIVDIHSCSNYVGWRAGRLDAEPPYADATRDNYEFTREDCTCGPYDPSMRINQEYNESKWLADLKEIAGLPKKLGVDNLLAIDIFNEPWDYTWSEWKQLSEKAYRAIDSVNKDILIMVEGVGSLTSDDVKVPHGDEASNPNWGENFFGAKTAPLNIPKERLIISPHTYGPSVFVQKQFIDPSQPECKDLEGDAAGDAQCKLVINAAKLEAGWEEHFGFLRDQGYAIVIGEFGGLMNWPDGAEVRNQNRWGYIKNVSPGIDGQWQQTFVNYMKKKGIQGCYWSINPESTDTGGLYTHNYDVYSKQGWGRWGNIDNQKMSLLNDLWGN